MKSFVFILAALLLVHCFCLGQVQTTHLLIEGLTDPIGIDAKTPVFSWQIKDAQRNVSKIRPHTGGGLTEATGMLLTPYGKLSAHWHWEKQGLALALEIPANSSATLYIPTTDLANITEGGRALPSSTEIRVKGREDKNILLELVSGTYQFRIKEWQGLR